MNTTTIERADARDAIRDGIARFLRVLGWTESTNPLGEIESVSPDREWQVQISQDGYWSLGKFTDSDVPDDRYKGGFVAVGRYESQAEGETLAELESAMVDLEAMPWTCPYCGEAGGTPVTVGWSEFQGCAEHGGMVEYQEEACSKCAPRF